jgi:membrane protease YdiL (CAAX protease family)
MTPFEEPPLPEQAALPEHTPVRGHPVAAWGIILAVVSAVVVLQSLRPAPVEKQAAPGQEEKGLDFMARLLVGLREVMGSNAEADLEKSATQLDVDGIRQHHRAAVVAGEVAGPAAALRALDRPPPAGSGQETAEEKRLNDLLIRLYRGHSDPAALAPGEQLFLREQLGWYGDLALAPRGGPDTEARKEVLAPAENLVKELSAAVAGGCGALVLGLLLLIVLLVVLGSGPQRRGFRPGSAYGGVYAETFALWLVVYLALNVAAAFVPGESHLFVGSLLGLGSLCVLAWPVLRGASWTTVRRDVGLFFGRRPVADILSGPVTYLASLPLLLLGLLAVFVLYQVLNSVGASPGRPSHPIEQFLVKPDSWVMFQVFFAACVQAPIVEETFFRGVLYRHLREATGAWGFALSLLASALINGFLFAVIHPQGPLGVPVLMALAVGFSLGREWRGSLASNIIAHGIHNGLTLLIATHVLSQ